MTDLFLQITSAVMLIALVITVTRQFHILQQSSYFNLRFWDYLKTLSKGRAVWSFVFAALTVALCFVSALAAMCVAAVTCLVRGIYAVTKSRSAKKKIVFTARVKRMYATLIVLCGLVVAASFFAPLFCTVLSAVMLTFSPFMAMAVNLINAPIEAAARQWYINDAKKILKSYSNLKIIGLTGSYGKTSTKYILGRILSEKYNVTITPGSFNTLLGVVRTVREHLKPDTQVFVVEMGAKQLKDIKEICDLVHPTMGVITSIGPQHLNTFGSIENVVKTKFELADEVEKNGGVMYLNLDNEYILKAADNYNHKGYGINYKDGYVYADNVSCTRYGLKFDAHINGRVIPLTTKLLGSHNVLNILAAVAIAVDMGLNDTDIKYAVERLEPVSHRLQLKPFLNGSVLIDDAYNANPSGSVEALNVIGSFAPLKRIVVTPGLVELGEREYECNVTLGEACAKNCDEIILVGIERSKPLAQGVKNQGFDETKLHIVKTFNDAAAMLRNMCDKDTVVLFENDLPDNYAR
ncbi:MAG: UDP-N-acetylmuramoyl-tripeptide--D-alanyl-D-alanine ligase [Clostridia bacterium]|nr:UDP-N-acetylmuramoyl-tripeptide--D-alanyl-D-alanine ligase [Clostridia bacterium]